MATIHVDGKALEVDGADNLLQACLSLGLDIPYFCWHPALGSVGACRQCAVKQYTDENDTRGRIVMSCMTPATDNTWISIDDEESKAFRASVVEWLMTNHPHDCPVCEEGGHCHLQDMTVMTGHNERRYRFTKRTHQNQELGPFIAHEMNRCIACYRCVRFYKDYAGGTDLGVFGAHDNVYFGRVEDGTLESEFSGNLTEVCPTGVFTDKTHSERYNRKWDMQFSPSICHGCSSGCNISPGERYGELRRIENRYNGSVNQYFLCDRGRFGYGYVNREDRPRQPLLNDGTKLSLDQALDKAADLLRGRNIVGIGSPRASLESNYALRELVGAEHFYSGIEAAELERIRLVLQVLKSSPLPVPTMRDIEDHDAVFVLGEDLTQTAARMALALRQSVKGKAEEMADAMRVQPWLDAAVKNIGQHALNPLFIASLAETKLDDVAEECVHAAPDDLARIGFAVAHALDASAPAVEGLDAEAQELAKRIADALLAAKRPLIIAGTSLGSKALIEAAANIAKALKLREKNGSISLIVPEANSLGLAMLGGESVDAALQAVIDGKADALVVLENDLYTRTDAAKVDAALNAAKVVIVADHQKTATSDRAHLVLPAASFAEGDGTLVSQEGRAQRFFQVFDPTYMDASILVHEGWRWLHALRSTLLNKPVDWTQLDHVTAACAQSNPQLARIVDAAPSASFRIKGLKLAREPLRYSGRTAMRADISVHEPRTPQDQDTAFSFSMEGYSGSVEPRSQVPFAWSPGWNSPQAWNKFQDEVGGHLRAGDPGTRLIESQGDSLGWFASVPRAFSPAQGTWQAVPFYHLFGSEENSSKAAPVQERIPAAYVSLAKSEADRLGVNDGALLAVSVAGQTLRLPLRINDELGAGLVALPAGLAGIPPAFFGKSVDGLQEAAQ
ncbi:NADH-ubiquinone oxidoreductase chain G [Pseudomonas chlororaphis subsp. aurantiaca]|uniref:NADH-quinone oxidoreductase subunit NuoG n=1 Tax=Pseudomonas chlororaphis TaxID=587753 RepID=UPI000F5628C8|nr:NADH-quinone oxidoreductase subunit NuoG [Pseudomonas chlororaphis]AZD36781.1 NADH-ubiquinone oxidoreductase chain G [Pseudomonas chlororaphis subsp. aurantiaca]AZD43121.1 NADH-ubiquinone oxidoreductase chain G [Pseudomonas chlororaphis subsp. aurantiaca]AZD55725.1 NADH-ubiquinone oxidoreductase chain G [Pseudomonas chlororaphis subsp. aurantiaca]AZD61761.1 NADH-ubiquinone oxidoreductase chain G [Pseudomonas chlororaphis subsp. aurantiaca]QQX56730.1 NADH-quinone oxidoreductase subunit NuoG 